MSRPEPRISMQIVEPLLDWLSGRGVDVTGLARAGKLPVPEHGNLEAMVPLSAYVDLFEQAAVACDDPYLGLHFGRLDEPGMLGALGYLFVSGVSLLDAFEGFCAHLDALQEGTTIRLLISGDTVSFQYRINDERIAMRRQDAEYSIAAMHALTRLYARRPVRPREVWFEHKLAGRYSIYREHFGCEVYFEQPCNGLVFGRADFNVRGSGRNRLLKSILASHLDGVASQHAPPRSFEAQVLGILEQRLTTASCTQAAVARVLGVSVSTFIRRLKVEGVSYRQLLQTQRLQRAERLLRLDDSPVASIALAVGYSDNASFTRAFRRRAGISPAEFRRLRRH